MIDRVEFIVSFNNLNLYQVLKMFDINNVNYIYKTNNDVNKDVYFYLDNNIYVETMNTYYYRTDDRYSNGRCIIAFNDKKLYNVKYDTDILKRIFTELPLIYKYDCDKIRKIYNDDTIIKETSTKLVIIADDYYFDINNKEMKLNNDSIVSLNLEFDFKSDYHDKILLRNYRRSKSIKILKNTENKELTINELFTTLSEVFNSPANKTNYEYYEKFSALIYFFDCITKLVEFEHSLYYTSMVPSDFDFNVYLSTTFDKLYRLILTLYYLYNIHFKI